MASSSGNSSWFTQNSGSEEDLQAMMDQRKRKRMQSNRESARRSRMRKQKHLDDLTARAAQLRNDNRQVRASISVTTQQLMAVEAENSVMRAQMAELGQRLQSLDDILACLEAADNGFSGFDGAQLGGPLESFMDSPWTLMCAYQQPLMAAADVFPY